MSASGSTPAPPLPRRRGRPPACPRAVVARVIELRHQGLSLAEVSDALNAESLPTPGGQRSWTKSHVDRLLHTRHAQDLMAELEKAPVMGGVRHRLGRAG